MNEPQNTQVMRSLSELRKHILELHRLLLDYEKTAYCNANKRTVTPGELVTLALRDPWFQWLRKLSEMIVEIDTLLEEKIPSIDHAFEILVRARGLFRPQNQSAPSEFDTRYREALMKAPAALLQHRLVQQALFEQEN